jgi:hypothetical protein
MYFLAFGLVPLMQVGLNWWIAIPLLIFLFYFKSVQFTEFKVKYISSLSLIFVIIFIETVFNSNLETRAILRVSREILCVTLLCISMGSATTLKVKYREKVLYLTVQLVSIFLLIFSSIQLAAINRGINLSLPETWYPRKLIVASHLDFTYSHIRPSATFTEPSYLGLIGFSLMCICFYFMRSSHSSRFLFYLNFLTICISQSKSGIFFGLLLIAYHQIRYNDVKVFWFNKIEGRKIFIVLIFLLVTGIVFNILNFGTSSSIADRLFKPARLLSRFLYENPFGVPYYNRLISDISISQNESWVALSHNGIFNILFDYGIIGSALIYLLILSVRKEIPYILLLLFLGVQNGGFFDFDKVALFMLVNTSIQYINVQRSSYFER